MSELENGIFMAAGRLSSWREPENGGWGHQTKLAIFDRRPGPINIVQFVQYYHEIEAYILLYLFFNFQLNTEINNIKLRPKEWTTILCTFV